MTYAPRPWTWPFAIIRAALAMVCAVSLVRVRLYVPRLAAMVSSDGYNGDTTRQVRRWLSAGRAQDRHNYKDFSDLRDGVNGLSTGAGSIRYSFPS